MRRFFVTLTIALALATPVAAQVVINPAPVPACDAGDVIIKSVGPGWECSLTAGTLTGSGTAGKIIKWATSTSLADSILTESGNTVSAAGGFSAAAGGFASTQGTLTLDAQAFSSIATWNDAAVTFTHWKANVTDTASAATSLLMDLQVGGVSKFSVTKAGLVTAVTGRIDGNLNFNAPTSGNVMLKPNGTQLDVRLGDDSGYGHVVASLVNATLAFQGPGTVALSGAVQLANGTEHSISARNAANTDDVSLLDLTNADVVRVGAANATRIDFGAGFTARGTSAYDAPAVGAELLDGSGWTSTGWTGDWAGGWAHTPGNTSVLSRTGAATVGLKYLIVYTITGQTAGSVVIGFGGETVTPAGYYAAAGGFGPTASTTAGLTLTPTTDFDGTVVLSLKQLTAVSTPLATFYSSDGTAQVEIRATPESPVDTTGMGTFIGLLSGGYDTGGGFANTGFGAHALKLVTSAQYNTAVGAWALQAETIGAENTALGADAMYTHFKGSQNVAVGAYALFSNEGGGANTIVGVRSGYGISGSRNTAVGNFALNAAGVSGNVALGYYAGAYETGSDAFYVDNQDRTNTAGDKAGALLYGTFNATPTLQTLTVNATATLRGPNDVGLVRGTEVTIAQDAVHSLGVRQGYVFIVNTDDENSASFLINGSYNTLTLINQNAGFSVTKDNASTVNVYWDTNAYYVQNKTSGTRHFRFVVLGI